MEELEKIIRIKLGQKHFHLIENVFDNNGEFCGEIKKERFDHKRFDMSCNDRSYKFEMDIENNKIYESFDDIISFNIFEYLFVSFWKGGGSIYFKYIGDENHYEYDVWSYGTVSIIENICNISHRIKNKEIKILNNVFYHDLDDFFKYESENIKYYSEKYKNNFRKIKMERILNNE